MYCTFKKKDGEGIKSVGGRHEQKTYYDGQKYVLPVNALAKIPQNE